MDFLNNFQLNSLMFLIPSLFMFCCGVYGFLTRRNRIAMLISLELMLNAVDMNFVVFNRFLCPGQMDGMFFTLFAIAIAAAETAVAIAIIINAYRISKDIDEILKTHGSNITAFDFGSAIADVPLPGAFRQVYEP